MARKPKRRYFPVRRSPGRARPDDAERQGRIDSAARLLANQHSLDELRGLVAHRTMIFEQADQAGTFDPGPGSLARFHSARTELEVAQRAVELASGADE
jgi:hypothetical protein